jgi:hypothetical protein
MTLGKLYLDNKSGKKVISSSRSACVVFEQYVFDGIIPSPTPTQTVTPTPTNTPTNTPTGTPAPTATVTPTVTPTPNVTPSPSPIVCGFDAASTIYSETRGWALTQNYLAGTTHPNPFLNYAAAGDDSTTMMTVFKPSGMVGDFGSATLIEFGRFAGGSPTNRVWLESAGGQLEYVKFQMTDEYNDFVPEGGPVQYQLSFDQPGWTKDHWYCYACNYEYDSNASVALVNLTLGEEITFGDIDGTYIPDLDTSTGVTSVVGYGVDALATDPPSGHFIGLMNQTLITRTYYDVSYSPDLRTLCDIDGILPLAATIGSHADTIYYSECGHPTQNTGVLDVDSGGYWLAATVELSADVPPSNY